ncbi:hypothetical protein [Falsiroseomonas sp. CW058]|uniref:hypothetical protein n=1 Tax=Falsiroseomonas sp. CW058 TaxID=3388664 RepID=UPI003D311176
MTTGDGDDENSETWPSVRGPLLSGPVAPRDFVAALLAVSIDANTRGDAPTAEYLSRLCRDIEKAVADGGDVGPMLARARLELGCAPEDDELLYDTGGAVGVAEAARLFGTTIDAVVAMIRQGQVLVVTLRGRAVLPRIQFRADVLPLGILPGIDRVVSAAAKTGAGGWHVLQWLVLPSAALGGREPVDALRAGDVDAVVTAATKEM